MSERSEITISAKFLFWVLTLGCIGGLFIGAYLGTLRGRAEQKKWDGAVKEAPAETTYWVICDDGFVIWAHGIADDQSRKTLCGEHGGKDPRRIEIKSAMGRDWKVVVTPINEGKPMNMEQELQSAPAKPASKPSSFDGVFRQMDDAILAANKSLDKLARNRFGLCWSEQTKNWFPCAPKPAKASKRRPKLKTCTDYMVDCNLPQPPCPEGTEISGGIASTGMVYPSGCRTPKQRAEYDDAFGKEMCEGELNSSSFSSDGTSESHTCKWINHQQSWTHEYEVKGKKVSKEEFERLNPIQCDPGWHQEGMGCTNAFRPVKPNVVYCGEAPCKSQPKPEDYICGAGCMMGVPSHAGAFIDENAQPFPVKEPRNLNEYLRGYKDGKESCPVCPLNGAVMGGKELRWDSGNRKCYIVDETSREEVPCSNYPELFPAEPPRP